MLPARNRLFFTIVHLSLVTTLVLADLYQAFPALAAPSSPGAQASAEPQDDELLSKLKRDAADRVSQALGLDRKTIELASLIYGTAEASPPMVTVRAEPYATPVPVPPAVPEGATYQFPKYTPPSVEVMDRSSELASRAEVIARSFMDPKTASTLHRDILTLIPDIDVALEESRGRQFLTAGPFDFWGQAVERAKEEARKLADFANVMATELLTPQNLASIGVGATPVAGEVYAIMTAVSGYDAITEAEVAGWERALLAFTAVVPVAGGITAYSVKSLARAFRIAGKVRIIKEAWAYRASRGLTPFERGQRAHELALARAEVHEGPIIVSKVGELKLGQMAIRGPDGSIYNSLLIPDFVDYRRGVVVEYKTGSVPDDLAIAQVRRYQEELNKAWSGKKQFRAVVQYIDEEDGKIIRTIDLDPRSPLEALADEVGARAGALGDGIADTLSGIRGRLMPDRAEPVPVRP